MCTFYCHPSSRHPKLPPFDPDDVMTHPYMLDDTLRKEWLSGLAQSFRAPRPYVAGYAGGKDDHFVRTRGEFRRARRAVTAARNNEQFEVTRRVRWQLHTRA